MTVKVLMHYNCRKCGDEAKGLRAEPAAAKREQPCPRCHATLTAAEVMHFRCPRCPRRLKVPPSRANKMAHCPGCGRELRVPPRPGNPDAGAPQDSLLRKLNEGGRYEVLGTLGRGGMGTVYKARHRLMGRLVAIKTMRQTLQDDPRAVERFGREILAANLTPHPNVVTVFDADCAGPVTFLVMEFVDGRDLSRSGPLPVHKACDYARQASLGLGHIHARGMVHRDIKPANLMLARDGTVKVGDLGLVLLPRRGGADDGRRPTAPGAFLGTVGYASPEQIADAASADHRADIYSLGCVLYELLAGRPPHGGGSPYETLLRHARATPEPLDRIRPEVPSELARLAERMIAKAPGDRPGGAKEVAEALLPFCRPPRRRRPWRKLLAAAAAAAAAVAAAVAAAAQR